MWVEFKCFDVVHNSTSLSPLHTSLRENIIYFQGVVKMRDSKFGVAMVLETTPSSGSFILGFRVDPIEKLKDIVQEIHSLYQVYNASPIFGVQYTIEDEVRKNSLHSYCHPIT